VCHKYVQELSGTIAPPDNLDPSSPAITVSIHPIAGFCTVSSALPLRQSVECEIVSAAVEGNGLNAPYGETVHCIAAEPHATFLRVGVIVEGQEVAYETAVLGRLCRGYRVIQMRSAFGTRIELCYVFVRVSFGSEPNFWATPRQLRIQSSIMRESLAKKVRSHVDENAQLKQELAVVRESLDENAQLKQEIDQLRRSIQNQSRRDSEVPPRVIPSNTLPKATSTASGLVPSWMRKEAKETKEALELSTAAAPIAPAKAVEQRVAAAPAPAKCVAAPAPAKCVAAPAPARRVAAPSPAKSAMRAAALESPAPDPPKSESWV